MWRSILVGIDPWKMNEGEKPIAGVRDWTGFEAAVKQTRYRWRSEHCHRFLIQRAELLGSGGKKIVFESLDDLKRAEELLAFE